MKYALISEEQIKQIEDALTAASYVPRGVMYPAGYHMQIAQALETMSALKPQEPVAYGLETDSGDVIDCITPAIYHDDKGEYTIPLFALEQT